MEFKDSFMQNLKKKLDPLLYFFSTMKKINT